MAQVVMIVKAEIGIPIENQTIQDGGGLMYESAIRFCGEAIGEACPPMSAANAIPKMRDLVYGDRVGIVLKIG
jgi:hypothetical protein